MKKTFLLIIIFLLQIITIDGMINVSADEASIPVQGIIQKTPSSINDREDGEDDLKKKSSDVKHTKPIYINTLPKTGEDSAVLHFLAGIGSCILLLLACKRRMKNEK